MTVKDADELYSEKLDELDRIWWTMTSEQRAQVEGKLAADQGDCSHGVHGREWERMKRELDEARTENACRREDARLVEAEREHNIERAEKAMHEAARERDEARARARDPEDARHMQDLIEYLIDNDAASDGTSDPLDAARRIVESRDDAVDERAAHAIFFSDERDQIECERDEAIARAEAVEAALAALREAERQGSVDAERALYEKRLAEQRAEDELIAAAEPAALAGVRARALREAADRCGECDGLVTDGHSTYPNAAAWLRALADEAERAKCASRESMRFRARIRRETLLEAADATEGEEVAVEALVDDLLAQLAQERLARRRETTLWADERDQMRRERDKARAALKRIAAILWDCLLPDERDALVAEVRALSAVSR